MKKILILLTLIIAILLSGCKFFSLKEANTGFFEESLLDECKLTEMPKPDSKDIRHDENTIYCNLTNVEYENYIEKVAAFIIAKDDIYFKGYHYETGNPGGIFFLPEYRFAPLVTDGNYSNWFAFSLTEKLNEGDEYNYSYWNGVTIKVERKSGEIGSYKYNTIIIIDTDPDCIVYQPTE